MVMGQFVDDASLSEIMKACVEAGKAVGLGRFTFTICYTEETDRLEGYIVHWFRPALYAFEDCRAVGQPGTARDCITQLAAYVATFEATREALPEVWQP